MCFYWSRAMISRDRHRIAPHKTDLTCMANGIHFFFGTINVSKFQNVWEIKHYLFNAVFFV